jgi:hypothetical protein
VLESLIERAFRDHLIALGREHHPVVLATRQTPRRSRTTDRRTPAPGRRTGTGAWSTSPTTSAASTS